ncbi:MAG: hypothetical protein V4649_12315 [Bacteroidota bacterium]
MPELLHRARQSFYSVPDGEIRLNDNPLYVKTQSNDDKVESVTPEQKIEEQAIKVLDEFENGCSYEQIKRVLNRAKDIAKYQCYLSKPSLSSKS